MDTLASVEIFDEDDDVPASKIILQVFRVKDGWLPNWYLEVRDEAELDEILALRDGVELVRVQFDRLVDRIISEVNDG